MLVVHDEVSMAHMGHPSAPYLSLDVRLSCWIDSESLLVSPSGDPIIWALPSPAWEHEGSLARSGALFLAPGMQ